MEGAAGAGGAVGAPAVTPLTCRAGSWGEYIDGITAERRPHPAPASVLHALYFNAANSQQCMNAMKDKTGPNRGVFTERDFETALSWTKVMMSISSSDQTRLGLKPKDKAAFICSACSHVVAENNCSSHVKKRCHGVKRGVK